MSHARLDNNVDVVIIGAGVSGLSAAYKLIQKNAGLDVMILEAKGMTNKAYQVGYKNNGEMCKGGLHNGMSPLRKSNCCCSHLLLRDTLYYTILFSRACDPVKFCKISICFILVPCTPFLLKKKRKRNTFFFTLFLAHLCNCMYSCLGL